MKQTVKGTLIALCVSWALALSTAQARADAGLIVETPTGILGFLSDVGHSSVWISHGCLSDTGEVLYCENSGGIVLSSTAYWSNPGAAAIPAELFFLGAKPGDAGRDVAAWNTSLGAAYPEVNPAYGRKYLGRVWRRGMRITTFKTTEEEDRRVLQLVEQQRKQYRYSYSHRNCAFYAERVLQLYLGRGFHSNRAFDLEVYTPRALERSLQRTLRLDPDASFRVLTSAGTFAQSWRQPPRGFCETALFDPKYAIPLLMYQPYIYAGFGACYGITRLTSSTWHKRHSTAVPQLAWADDRPREGTNRRIAMYQSLTGSLPANPAWVPAAAPTALLFPGPIHAQRFTVSPDAPAPGVPAGDVYGGERDRATSADLDGQ